MCSLKQLLTTQAAKDIHGLITVDHLASDELKIQANSANPHFAFIKCLAGPTRIFAMREERGSIFRELGRFSGNYFREANTGEFRELEK